MIQASVVEEEDSQGDEEGVVSEAEVGLLDNFIQTSLIQIKYARQMVFKSACYAVSTRTTCFATLIAAQFNQRFF